MTPSPDPQPPAATADAAPLVRPVIERIVADNRRLRHELTIGRRRYTLDGADSDALLDQLIASGGDERLMPYWADVWPSGVALAAWLDDHAALFAGRPALDLGCGLGLAGIAVATAGARPVFLADLHREAAAFAAHNAALCGVGDACRPLPFDWSADAIPDRVEWVVAADILFERPEHDALERLLAGGLGPEVGLVLADPLRTSSREFLARPGVVAALRPLAQRRVELGDREHTIHLYANDVARRRLAAPAAAS